MQTDLRREETGHFKVFEEAPTHVITAKGPKRIQLPRKVAATLETREGELDSSMSGISTCE